MAGTVHPPQDWQCDKSLTECNDYVFKQQVACDVTFKFADKSNNVTYVPAHRYPLSIRSPVFFAMFHGGLAENSDSISVQDVVPNVFHEMIRYVSYHLIFHQNIRAISMIYYEAMPHIVNAIIRECRHKKCV